MSRILIALALIAALVVTALVLTSGDPQVPGPEPVADSAPGEAAAGGMRTRAQTEDDEVRGAISGTVLRVGVGFPASLDLYLLFPGKSGSRGPTSQSTEEWLTRVMSRTEPVRTLATGKDGTFVIEGLSPGEYRLAARTESGSTGHVRVDLPSEGAAVWADINVFAGPHTLRGRLVTADGAPFPALVWVLPGARPMTRMKQTDGTAPIRSGADGTFAVSGLDEGTVNVSVLRPGAFFTSFIGVSVPREGELVLVVDEGFKEVSGRILAAVDGIPVAGASVSIWGRDRGRASTSSVATGEDGTFRLNAPAGEISIGVRAEGFVPVISKRQAASGIEIRLSRWAVVLGRVVADPDGTPVAGVPVKARALDTGKRSRLKTDTVSGADGSFRIEAAPGDTMVYAIGNGWIPVELLGPVDPKQCLTSFVLEPGEEREVTLRVSPAARAEGVVLDAEGRGVAGAVVWANRVGETARASTVAPHRPSGTTAADGRFEIDTLVPGFPYNFSTQPSGYGWNRSEVFVADGDEPISLEFRLARPHWIEVRVVDATDDRPIAGARVRVSTAMGEWRTGEDGLATAGPASPGKFSAWAGHPSYVEVRRGQAVTPPTDGSNPPPVTVRLAPAFRISGTAFLSDGRPHTTGTVYSQKGRSLSGATIPGQDGSFRLSRLAAGTHRLVAQGVHHGRTWVGEAQAEAGAENVQIILTDRGAAGGSSVEKATILVRAVAKDGFPVVGGRAELVGERTGVGRGMVGGEARLFEMSGKEVRAVVIGARSGTGERLAATLSGPVEPGKREVTVVLGPALSVTGRLIDPDGNPVAGVGVSLLGSFDLPDGKTTRQGWHAHTRTRRDGSFTLSGLGEARYRLDLDLPSIYVKPQDVEVHPGGTPLTIRLERALAGILRVTDSDGRPVGGAVVRISGHRKTPGGGYRGTGGRSPPPQTDPAGNFRFGPLDPEFEYDLRVLPPKGREELAEFEHKGWTPADTAIRLSAGLPLSGKVRLIGGRTMPEMKVWCRPAGGSSRSTKPGSNGSFAFTNLPPGTVELGISLDRIGMVTWDRRIEVQAGRTDVIYDVDLGLPLFVTIENWPEGQGEYKRFVTLVPASGMPENPSLAPRARLGRRIRFEGLPADETYTIRIIGMDDGTCYVRSGIRGSTEPMNIRLVPGKTIRGHLVVPAGHRRISVYARSAFDSVHGKVSPDGTFEIPGMPEGTWEVVAQAYGEGNLWSRGEAKVEAGEEVTITLSPRDD